MNDINIFKSGDKVVLAQRGVIDWEEFDYTSKDFANLKEDKTYTVHEACYECETPNIELREDELGFSIHPNHFKHA